jgi:GYF domain 2
MSASWMVTVGGRPYGPYTDAQMAAFAAEGRLAPQSLIARVGENNFRLAIEDADLAPLFFAQPAPAESTPANVVEPGAKPAGMFGKNKDDGQKNGELSHVVVIVDMKSGSIASVEEAVYKLGQAFPIFPQAWLLRTDQSVNTVRNQLIQRLGKLDVIFVVDATNDKAAWFNYGPEAEARIRRIWTRTQETPTKIRAAV